ncbi:zinc ribbon domain-containing protein YjdM [Acetobacter fallax]|uniref:Alkylphosphonate utilization protein n=1 Tax=Acetobacter fallax TaxID=1737473 RepID=A0ABX0KAV2_9PROT|nr:zinc ribbon domain-containing protein YjdM [Acetobacter fallax]NHO32877.1 alkylphosphonate utilization protein [Acetobacter fallax]NHO36439.1 alkylphosphonate utilization protein [Acetobacter fallax]
MNNELKCPECGCEHVYQDGSLWICPECAHEFNPQAAADNSEAAGTGGDGVIRDANGNTLGDGDTVTVIKDLKVKGSSLVVKSGTKVKNIRLVDGSDGHNIACKINGIGAMNLKSEFVKKS